VDGVRPKTGVFWGDYTKADVAIVCLSKFNQKFGSGGAFLV